MKLHRLQPLAIRIARALLIRTLRPQLRRQLAAIFAETDATIPESLAAGAPPIVVEGLIVQAVKRVTGVQPTASDIQVIGALFDVVAAAVPLSKR